MFRYIRTRKLVERVALTPEGFVYVVVLCFITVGSVLRNVNLLILMAGMMYAPLFINWRLAIRRLGTLRAQRQMPRRVHANQLVSVQWQCENEMRQMAAYNVIVEDQIRRVPQEYQSLDRDPAQIVFPKPPLWEKLKGDFQQVIRKRRHPENVSVAQVRYARLLSGKPETLSYRAFFGKRGKYLVGPAQVSTAFPFGLITSRNRIDPAEVFFVAPELGHLIPTWERRVRSTATGSDSRNRTRSLEEDEFYALRPWRSGDSKKNIHWRTTARQGYPIVKQHDQQNNRDFALILDLHGQPETSVSELCEQVLSFAATVVLAITQEVQGRMVVACCGQQRVACRSRTPQGLVGEIMPVLAVAQSSANPQTVDGIIDAFESVSGGTPIYVVSSRPRPASLELMLPASVEDRNDPHADQRSARSLTRRLRSALPMVRWLDVQSEEFNRIFSMDPTRNETLPDGLNQLAEKWLVDAEH